jgi:hypothetical protein
LNIIKSLRRRKSIISDNPIIYPPPYETLTEKPILNKGYGIWCERCQKYSGVHHWLEFKKRNKDGTSEYEKCERCGWKLKSKKKES